MTIPKIIHYCWFGGKPLPKSAEKCISSWKKFFPDYEIKRWDESNFDVNIIPYTSQAYQAKKYAFVSDYARFWIIHKHGGLYFDTDVEVIKPFDDIIAAGAFIGCENPYTPGCNASELAVAAGLGIGAPPDFGLYDEIIKFYDSINFENPDGKSNPETVVTYVTNLLISKGLVSTGEIQNIEGLSVYPSDYFCPISTKDGKLRLTTNTRSIHHYDQTWQSPTRKYGRKLILAFGGVKLKNTLKKLLFNK